MAAERPKTSRDAFNPFADGYAAWLNAFSPLSDLSERKAGQWRQTTAELAAEAKRLAEDSREHLHRVAELQLATAQKALAARHPGAMAEISSEWTAASLSLASSQARRRGEALSRMIDAFWAIPAKA